jgi:histidine triad (HIT) family protein
MGSMSAALPTAMGDPACVFCQVIVGSSAAVVVAATAEVLAFLDTRPVFPGHVLVVPRTHLETLEELPDALLVPLYGVVREVATAVRGGLGAGGAFVATNNRVSQSVPHLHVHVIPRTKGDGLRGFFWPRRRYDDDAEAADIGARISAALPPDLRP